MKINVYLNEQFYKAIDFGDRNVYDPKMITDMILADKENNTLDAKFNIEQGIKIKIEKV
jgi:hypothetical protein